MVADLRGGSSSIESSSIAAGKAGWCRGAFFSCSWRTLLRTACGVMPGTSGCWIPAVIQAVVSEGPVEAERVG